MELVEQPIVWNVFKKELELLQDQDIREFVVNAFGELCPQYFWYIPASVRGHHPPICRTRGGLVHHTKLAVGFADGFIDMWDIIAMLQRDQIIAGVMLHDMMKRGLTDDELDTFEDHRQAKHMGRWTLDVTAEELFELENNIVVRTVHLADYTASRALHQYLAERHTDESMRYVL
jgi:hypothetical protein